MWRKFFMLRNKENRVATNTKSSVKVYRYSTSPERKQLLTKSIISDFLRPVIGSIYFSLTVSRSWTFSLTILFRHRKWPRVVPQRPHHGLELVQLGHVRLHGALQLASLHWFLLQLPFQGRQFTHARAVVGTSHPRIVRSRLRMVKVVVRFANAEHEGSCSYCADDGKVRFW